MFQAGRQIRPWRLTMRSHMLFLALILFPFPLAAQEQEAMDRGYVWQQGDECVRFDRGKWSAGIEGKGSFSWHMFLWHDKWIYETLPGGEIEKQPVLQDDGSLTMEGTFSAREDSPPLKYAYRITPQKEGLRVRCELQKTAPLKLTRGVFLHVSGSREALEGSQRVWFAPSSHGTLATAPPAPANRVLLELQAGAAFAWGCRATAWRRMKAAPARTRFVST